MDASDLKVLQAASQVLNEVRPERSSVELLTEYASEHLPERLDLPPDELATVVALRLMDIPGDLK
jgi:hypothetical protein